MLQIPVWTVYLVALHYHHRLSGEQFALDDLLMLLCLTLLSAGAYYINQVYDYHSDLANKKGWFLQRGVVSMRAMTGGFVILSLLSFVGGVYFYRAYASPMSLFLFVQLFLLAYAYSAPPLRLKDRPFWGLFANAWGHGFLISFSVMPEINVHNAGLLGWDNPFYFLFAVAGTTCLTTIPDVAGDSLTRKRTIAVQLGRRWTLVIALLFFLLSAWSALRSEHWVLLALSTVSILVAAAALLSQLDWLLLLAVKLPILLLTLLAGWLYPMYFLFIVALFVLTRIYYLKRFGIVYPRLT